MNNEAVHAEAPVLNERQFLTAGFVVGCLIFIGHAIFLPPGWLWETWSFIYVGGGIAFVAGYWGFGPLNGIGGASAPGIALALRGEIIMYQSGCHTHVSMGRTCSVPPTNEFQYQLQLLGLSIGLVLAGVAIGYALGAGARRARAWISDQERSSL